MKEISGKMESLCKVFIVILCFSKSTGEVGNNYNPYDHVYPYVDIGYDQQNCSVTENGTCPLYIALMMSFGGEFDSSSVIPGVQMAIDQINSDPTMLSG